MQNAAAPSRSAQRRALTIALVANGLFLGAEVAGGLIFGSLALLADAAHMLSDVAALGLALVAQRLLERPTTAKHTFGLQRAEVLGAQANALVLLGVSAWILFEAYERLRDPAPIEGGGVIAVATLGLAVNVGSALILHRAAGHSLNMRGAVTHMVADAAGSVGVILSALAVIFWGAMSADPIVSAAITVLIVWSAWKLLRETVHVLLEGAPRGMDVESVRTALLDEPDVDDVHHLHVWTLASDTPALSAHVVMSGEMSLHQAQLAGDAMRVVLAERFGIEHATLELECHPCDPEDAAPL